MHCRKKTKKTKPKVLNKSKYQGQPLIYSIRRKLQEIPIITMNVMNDKLKQGAVHFNVYSRSKNSNLHSLTYCICLWMETHTTRCAADGLFLYITRRMESCAVWWQEQLLHWGLWRWTGLKLKLHTEVPHVWSQRAYQRKRSCFPAREENSAHCGLLASLQNTDSVISKRFEYRVEFPRSLFAFPKITIPDYS